MTKPTKPRATKRKAPREPLGAVIPFRPRPKKRGPHTSWVDESGVHLRLQVEDVDAKEARRLAAWLLKAADYLEAKEKG